MGALFSRQSFLTPAIARLTDAFGPLCMESPAFAWSHSDHYRDELGWPLQRKLFFFDTLINQDQLVEAKDTTISIESDLSSDSKRTVNLDPGYVTEAKVVLATTKDYAHRLYMRDGICAEVSLMYSKDRFQPTPFTYDDYKQETHLAIFKEARTMLRKKLGRENP